MAPPTILVVDDDASVRTIISAMLEPAGYEPVLASSAEEAIARLDDGLKPRLILSDIVMTGMTGLALLDHVRERHAEIPIVMVSGVSDLAVAIGTLRNGAYDYLLKPFERDQLLGTVLRALEYRALVEQNNVYRTHLEELVAARTEMLNSAIGDLERSYDITLEALGDALDLKDTETEGHSRRVTAYTIALARAMQLPPQEIRNDRPRRVSARHGQDGDSGRDPAEAGAADPRRAEHHARALRAGLPDAAQDSLPARSGGDRLRHQEHFDGSGYPRGLHGEEIPLGARIFAVADALDAITSDRPYRSATSFATARQRDSQELRDAVRSEGGGRVPADAGPRVGGPARGDSGRGAEVQSIFAGSGEASAAAQGWPRAKEWHPKRLCPRQRNPPHWMPTR